MPSDAAEAVSSFEIDLSQPYRPVTRVASGMLYGLAEEGRPADRWIAPLKPKNFTQMAPGGQQLPNGETAPTGDALVVAPIADRHGATVTIRMPDIYPNFPCQKTGRNAPGRIRCEAGPSFSSEPFFLAEQKEHAAAQNRHEG
ncbi:MAG: hypothetical protein BAA02_04795 [Paenibacillaceae bacterium ZCTH02-B3]|nr:MAG: hypothetical protein BAA02_04795 [Paenibacillaceae bacterium ZCTH02-B3]